MTDDATMPEKPEGRAAEPAAPDTAAPDTAAPDTAAPADAPPGDEPPPLSLLYLDVDDEITSAAARIRAAGAEEVALVLPYGSRLATSRINFRLLAREAAARGKKLEIIGADASARALAIAAGLPTHASVAAFEAYRRGETQSNGSPDAPARNEDGAVAAASRGRRFARVRDRVGGRAGGVAGVTDPGATEATSTDAPATGVAAAAGVAAGAAAGATAGASPGAGDAGSDVQTRVLTAPRRKAQRVPIVGPPRPPVRTGIAVGVGLAVIATIVAGGLLALELLPSATITLNPRSEALGPIEMTVEAREDVDSPDAASLTIPARRLTFQLEATESFAATGTHVELKKATGSVTFSNFDTGSAIRVEEGVILATREDVEFRTLDAITLPNATIQFPFTIVPSTRTVDIEAVEAGPGGNVGNNTITEVPKGVNKRLLQVTNLEATAGGARTESPEVTADDVESAKSELTAALAEELDRQVAAGEGIPAGITLFPSTRAVGEAEYSVDPESLVGRNEAEFNLGATAEGTALGVDPAPIQALAEARLATRVRDGWSLQGESVTSEIGEPAVLGTAIAYPVSIQAMQVHDVDENAILAAVKGLGLPEARARLDDFGDVAIDVWPDWVTKIPSRSDRVTLNVAAPQPSAAP